MGEITYDTTEDGKLAVVNTSVETTTYTRQDILDRLAAIENDKANAESAHQGIMEQLDAQKTPWNDLLAKFDEMV